MIAPIDIQENKLLAEHPALLELLLKDHSTQRGIYWATDSYASLGEGYTFHDEITPERITGSHGDLIKPRAVKAREEQQRRSRAMAEVFTPSWLCNVMNNEADASWFGRRDVFNVVSPDCRSWQPTAGPIAMPAGESWQSYVSATRLEITCGEAPFLVSRYDTVTGAPIPIERRIGMLDRKLRVVGENATSPEQWQHWALVALSSIYGYEWQGDSLLLAREAVLATLADYYEHRFGQPIDDDLLTASAEIVACNLWQMDGLKGVLPQSCTHTRYMTNQSGEKVEYHDPCRGCETGNILAHNGTYCKIKRWNIASLSPATLDGDDLLFSDLFKPKSNNDIFSNEEDSTMKFDYIIGNPPYQEETNKGETNNGQHPSKSIFQFFQDEADAISLDCVCLVYPGGRWIQRSGKGMQKFGLKQINDSRLQAVYFFPQSKALFGEAADLTDGISIVIKKQSKTSDEFEYHYCEDLENDLCYKVKAPGSRILELNPADAFVMKKVDNFSKEKKLHNLHDRILSRSLFSIESDFVEKNPDKVTLYDGNLPTGGGKIKLLTNNKSGKSGRAKWYITSENVIPESSRKYINQWQVIVSSANAGGQKRDNQISIADNHTAFGRVRVALGSFKTKEEAENFLSYCQTYIIRFAFLMTDEALTSLAMRVPDLGDYTSKNKLVDFSKDLNQQLYKLMNLDKSEQKFVEQKINDIDIKRGKRG